MPDTDTKTRIQKVATVMMPVADQDRALDFYVGVLGLEKRTDQPYGNGDRWVEVGPRGGETTVALVPPMQGQGTPGESGGPRPTHCTFYTEDIDADHAYLKSRGVDVDDLMRNPAPVPPMFFFRDVDGNSLLLVGQL
ncbi:MAG TPA: VOC family protein [Candidatus Dormibacteraeota bacterium]|nr:VOC family protein [Candidatus Dormibacteraeota bacterium]